MIISFSEEQLRKNCFDKDLIDLANTIIKKRQITLPYLIGCEYTSPAQILLSLPAR